MTTTRYRLNRQGDAIECRGCRGHGMTDIGDECRACEGSGKQVCSHCVKADAVVVIAAWGDPVCETCWAIGAQDILAATPVDGDIAALALNVSQLISLWPNRVHVVTIALPRIADTTLARFRDALLIHGLDLEADHIEGIAEIRDNEACCAWFARDVVARAHAKVAS